MKSFRKSVLHTAISLALACVMAPLLAHTDAPHAPSAPHVISPELHPWGQQGEAKKVTRTITISMTDNMRFTPNNIKVKEGETIKFIVKNRGKMLHEMVIGTEAELAKHAELMKKHPNMEHEQPYMAHVAAAKSTTLIWKFTNPGNFMFACLIPGHFEAGMKGLISVAAAKKPIATSTPTKEGNTMNRTAAVIATSAVLASAAATPVAAHAHPAPVKAESSATAQAPKPEMVDAEVKKIDVDAKKITLKHAEIKSLDMPGMTMVFQVKEAKLLEGVKVGDKIKVSVEQSKSAYVVTSIEASK